MSSNCRNEILPLKDMISWMLSSRDRAALPKYNVQEGRWVSESLSCACSAKSIARPQEVLATVNRETVIIRIHLISKEGTQSFQFILKYVWWVWEHLTRRLLGRDHEDSKQRTKKPQTEESRRDHGDLRRLHSKWWDSGEQRFKYPVSHYSPFAIESVLLLRRTPFPNWWERDQFRSHRSGVGITWGKG